MWGPLYLAVAAFAAGCTYFFLVREQTVVDTSAAGFVCWAVLAVTPEITLASGGETLTIAVGPVRWVVAALAILSFAVLFLAIFGYYPHKSTDQTFTPP